MGKALVKPLYILLMNDLLLKKSIYLLALISLVACTNGSPPSVRSNSMDSLNNSMGNPADSGSNNENIVTTPTKVYNNDRFKEVTVEQVEESKFIIRGKGQIFEANFNWVVEDGHNELLEGFEMTSAGAPEWGDFQFTVEAKKIRPNSTLMLFLFEISAKDGSRQYQLPIKLY